MSNHSGRYRFEVLFSGCSSYKRARPRGGGASFAGPRSGLGRSEPCRTLPMLPPAGGLLSPVGIEAGGSTSVDPETVRARRFEGGIERREGDRRARKCRCRESTAPRSRSRRPSMAGSTGGRTLQAAESPVRLPAAPRPLRPQSSLPENCGASGGLRSRTTAQVVAGAVAGLDEAQVHALVRPPVPAAELHVRRIESVRVQTGDGVAPLQEVFTEGNAAGAVVDILVAPCCRRGGYGAS